MVDVAQAFFKTIARAQFPGETVGLLKILFHRDTLEVLGINYFGDQAAEAYRIAALNGLYRVDSL